MNADLRRARVLAALLDFLVPAAAADTVGLVAAAVIWSLRPGAVAVAAWIWAALAAGAVATFLLRDAAGGRARRWLGLETRDARGRVPGAAGSIRRNLPLLVAGWNLIEVWPVLRDGAAPRRADRKRGLGLVRSE